MVSTYISNFNADTIPYQANRKCFVLGIGILNVEDSEEKFEAGGSVISSDFDLIASEGIPPSWEVSSFLC